MNERYGVTLRGKRSAHTKNNTGPRQYLVVEFDSGSYDQHAALLVHLSGMAPLVLAVMSGNKSLHGWFNVQRSGESKQYRFMRYAVSLGADPVTWTRCQFVRMPDGVRDNGNRQSVLYFNPTNL